MKVRDRDEDGLEIAMAPLIDVVFLLLIFFLVATTFARKEIDQQVKLPASEGGQRTVERPEIFVINIREDGTLVVDGRIVDLAQLRLELTEWHGSHPDRPAAIRGDEAVPYGRVSRVMGICRSVGIRDVDLPVEDLSKGAAGP
jgi:biopolymer transport protein ExbD